MIEILLFTPLIVAAWMLGAAIILFIVAALWGWIRG